MKHLIALSLILIAASCTDSTELGSTSQHAEVIVVVGTAPPDCADYGNYENTYDSAGNWTGCQCFAFCSPPRQPADPGDGGGGGGSGGESSEDAQRRQELRSCLDRCETSTSQIEEQCLDTGTDDAGSTCVLAIADRCLGARELCRGQFHRPDDQPIPLYCRKVPTTATCQAEFASCELAWKFGPSRLARGFRQHCWYAEVAAAMTCNRTCFAEFGDGLSCDVSVEGESRVDDGTLDSDGRCWGDDGDMADCAANPSNECQYGAEANND